MILKLILVVLMQLKR